jgi:hypothetical protein
MIRVLRFAPASLFALLLACADFAVACPGCKEALASQQNGANIVAGYQWSILFMMAMPFSLLGLFSAYMWWEVKKARAAQEAAAAKAQAKTAAALPHEPAGVA